MSLYRQFEFASQADLDKFNKLIEQHNIDAVEMDGFDEVDHTRNAEEYLKMAEVYLKQDNPDTMQAGEKLWGCVTHVVQEFYTKKLGVNFVIKSHKAVKVLCLFAIQKFHNVSTIVQLTTAFDHAENAHRNFYRDFLTISDLNGYVDEIQYFAKNFGAKIGSSSVKEILDPFVFDGKDPKELGFKEDIKFYEKFDKKTNGMIYYAE